MGMGDGGGGGEGEKGHDEGGLVVSLTVNVVNQDFGLI